MRFNLILKIDIVTLQSAFQSQPMSTKIKLGNREFHLPRSRLVRLVIGLLLIVGGLLGFLPVLGFWMIPLGLLILSVDLAVVRRYRRRFEVWLGRRRESENENGDGTAGNSN